MGSAASLGEQRRRIRKDREVLQKLLNMFLGIRRVVPELCTNDAASGMEILSAGVFDRRPPKQR